MYLAFQVRDVLGPKFLQEEGEEEEEEKLSIGINIFFMTLNFCRTSKKLNPTELENPVGSFDYLQETFKNILLLEVLLSYRNYNSYRIKKISTNLKYHVNNVPPLKLLFSH